MSSNLQNTARLETRISTDLRDQLRRAAALQGRSVSDYVADTLKAAMARDIEHVEIIKLSRGASEVFAAALIDPPPPTGALLRAVEHHRRLVRAR